MFKELILVVFVDVSQYKFIILWNIAVAPFAGAWIEIANIRDLTGAIKSLPSRERGLKFPRYCLLLPLHRSLPSRERGLKYFVNSHILTS